MAKTKNEEYIVEQYVRYFGETPTDAEIAKYAKFGKAKLILNEIKIEAGLKNANMSKDEQIHDLFNNLFGRDALDSELTKYKVKYLDKGKALPINSIIKAAKKGSSDKAVWDTKKAVAFFIAEKGSTTNIDLDKITKDTYKKIFDGKKLTITTIAELETKIDAMPDNVAGETFNLTASANNFVGTEKGDVFNAYEEFSSGGPYLTLTSIDSLDGGEGKDTLNVKTDAAIAAVTATVKSIETINLESGAGVAFDTTTYTGVETLNVTKATTVDVDAAATTDVNVSGATGATIDVDGGKNVVVSDATVDNSIKIGATTGAAGTITVTDTKQGTGDIKVDGGTDVTVTATAADISTGATSTTGAIKIGQNATAILPTGDVKVTQNLEFDGNDAGAAAGTVNLTGGDITISGGKTVDVTVNANNVAKVAGANDKIVVGTITVEGGDNTTTVTVTQNDNSEKFTSAKVAEVKDTQTITFKALTAGQHVSITDGGAPAKILTFTASKDLTAEEVAAAFANLSAGDYQASGGKVANGTFSGQFSTNWSAKSVNGAAVTFEAPESNTSTLADGSSDVVPTFGTVVGGTAASGGNESLNSVVYGQVVINNTAKTGTTDAIKTVSVDGYANSAAPASASSTITSDALTDVTLKNSAGDMTISSTVASLNLTVDNINDDVTLTAANLKTLNLTTTGEEESVFGLISANTETLTIAAAADLDIATGSTLTALKTVTITGAGKVNLGDISSATALNSFNASANTGGVTAEIETEIAAGKLTGTITEYIFSAGNDVVTLKDTVVETKITLGAGDDKITLVSNTGIADVVATIDGGTGSNTIDMDAADAEILSSDGTFEGKISNFQKLSLGQVATTADNTVNLANIDDISYVISAGTADTAEVTTVAITVGTAIAAGDTASITIDGTTYTTAALVGNEDATAIALALDTAVGTNYNVTNNTGTLTITSATGKMSNVGSVSITGTGAVSGVKTITSSELFLTNMANNGTLELTADGMGATVTMKDASGNSDTFKIVTGDEAGNVGTVVVNSVETINVTTTDIFTDDGVAGGIKDDGKDDSNSSSTLVVSADAAKTVNVSGAGDLILNTTSVVLTKVDASKMTGDLVYTADGAAAGTEVIAGSGNDTLIAFGEKDVLKGNAGNDTFNAYDLTKVYGGADADTFNFYASTSLAKVSTIMDSLTSGDTFNLFDDANADTAVNKFYAEGAQYNATVANSVALRVDASIQQTAEGEATWFQFGNNTYIVIDGTNSNDTVYADVYEAGRDTVIEITGLVDLSKASFNATTGTLEIA